MFLILLVFIKNPLCFYHEKNAITFLLILCDHWLIKETALILKTINDKHEGHGSYQVKDSKYKMFDLICENVIVILC